MLPLSYLIWAIRCRQELNNGFLLKDWVKYSLSKMSIFEVTDEFLEVQQYELSITVMMEN